MLLAPLIAGVVAAFKIQFVYPIAALLIFVATVVLSIVHFKQKAQA